MRPELNEAFNNLTTNAIEFLDEAIDQVKTKPKLSIINFYTAVELFLKARLLQEHWTLILDNRNGKAKFENFRSGDFISASYETLRERLRDVVGDPITNPADACFDALRKRRNMVVHYFHADESPRDLQEIISKQCEGWHHLSQLLNVRWKDQFYTFQSCFDSIENRMSGHREFLKARFNEVKPQLEAAKSAGGKIEVCPSCKFKSAVIRKEQGLPLKVIKCGVCRFGDEFVSIGCPECSKEVRIWGPDMGEKVCPKCGSRICLEDLESALTDERNDPELGEDDELFCSACETTGEPTVHRYEGGMLCLRCLSVHFQIGMCEYCQTSIAGFDTDDSYLWGCPFCDGRLADEKD